MQALADEYDNILLTHLRKRETNEHRNTATEHKYRATENDNGNASTASKVVTLYALQENKSTPVSKAV